jgi:ArsR family transcriptional regulator
MVLREAGLVGDRRDGWNVYYQVTKPELFAVIDAAHSTVGENKRLSLSPVIGSCACPHCTGEKTSKTPAMAAAD